MKYIAIIGFTLVALILVAGCTTLQAEAPVTDTPVPYYHQPSTLEKTPTSSAYIPADLSFINSAMGYLQEFESVNNGISVASGSQDISSLAYYAQKLRSLVDRYYPDLAGYKVSDKIKPIRDEQLRELEDRRLAADNWLKSEAAYRAHDATGYLKYLKNGITNYDDANTHSKRVSVLITEIT